MRFVVTIIIVAMSSGCADDLVEATPLRLLQANIGTVLLDCDRYVYKLCDVATEDAVAASIFALDPDVIALQEVLPDRVCDAIDDDGGESDDARSCFAAVRAAQPTQLRRLLPEDDWDVRCDERNGYECVAARVGRVAFVSDYVTADAIDSAVDDANCDDGFTVGRVDLDVSDRRVRVINGHPQSTNAACRAAQVEQIFGALANDDNDDVDATVVSGDMNLDPFGFGLDENDVSVPVWSDHLVDDGFVYASGVAERASPYPTTNSLFAATLDHVVVRGASGVCTTQGGATVTRRLDGDDGAMDHRALDCALFIP